MATPPPLPSPPPASAWESQEESPPPRCISCGYVLTGLSATRCPECGRTFDLRDPLSFTLKPPFLGWKFWMPGLTLAVLGGLGGAIGLLGVGNWGWSLWFGVPFSAGSILGYRVRSRWFVLPMLIIFTIAGLCMGLIALDIAGIFCGLALVGIFFGPLLVGTMLGSALRMTLKLTRFSQRSHLPIFLILAALLICGLVEGPPREPQPIESVSTSIIIPAPVAACWDAIMFYEDVRHEPPFILKIGLAHPLYTTGRSSSVGDVKTCVYNKGRITKRIAEALPHERLAFKIIEQDIGYERDVRLVAGSFMFDPIGPGITRVTLTTSYEPLLRPRWCWRPFEAYAVHTLHEHVLEGMRRKADAHRQAELVTFSLPAPRE